MNYLSNFHPKVWWIFAIMGIILISVGIESYLVWESALVEYQTLEFNSEFTAWRVGVGVNLLHLSALLCFVFGLGFGGLAYMIYHIIDDRKIGYKVN